MDQAADMPPCGQLKGGRRAKRNLSARPDPGYVRPMEQHSLISLSDGSDYCVPHPVAELLQLLECARRWDELAELELSCGCGPVWINPRLVTSIQVAEVEDEEPSPTSRHRTGGHASQRR